MYNQVLAFNKLHGPIVLPFNHMIIPCPPFFWKRDDKQNVVKEIFYSSPTVRGKNSYYNSSRGGMSDLQCSYLWSRAVLVQFEVVDISIGKVYRERLSNTQINKNK